MNFTKEQIEQLANDYLFYKYIVRNDESQKVSKAYYQGFQDCQKMDKYVPYQACPICYGIGVITNQGNSSSVFSVCSVCNGAKIIPMHLVELPTPPKEKGE